MNNTVGFPDKRWGSPDGWLSKATYRIVSTRPGSWVARRTAPLDRRILLRSNGRFSLLGPIGAPTMLLTTTGAKSGAARISPLLYARDGERLIVAGSNFGQEKHPAWTGNLLKDANAVVAIGGRSVPAVAALLDGPEADKAYGLMKAAAPMYGNYQQKTDRDIRVFALTAV